MDWYSTYSGFRGTKQWQYCGTSGWHSYFPYYGAGRQITRMGSKVEDCDSFLFPYLWCRTPTFDFASDFCFFVLMKPTIVLLVALGLAAGSSAASVPRRTQALTRDNELVRCDCALVRRGDDLPSQIGPLDHPTIAVVDPCRAAKDRRNEAIRIRRMQQDPITAANRRAKTRRRNQDPRRAAIIKVQKRESYDRIRAAQQASPALAAAAKLRKQASYQRCKVKKAARLAATPTDLAGPSAHRDGVNLQAVYQEEEGSDIDVSKWLVDNTPSTSLDTISASENTQSSCAGQLNLF